MICIRDRSCATAGRRGSNHARAHRRAPASPLGVRHSTASSATRGVPRIFGHRMFGVPHPSQRYVLTRGMGPVRCVSCARERSRMVQMLPSERRPCRIVGARPSQQGRDAPLLPSSRRAARQGGAKAVPPWSGVLSPTAVEGGASVAEAAEPFEVPLPAVLAHRIGGGVALPHPG